MPTPRVDSVPRKLNAESPERRCDDDADQAVVAASCLESEVRTLQIEFSVPLIHRVSFTANLAQEHFAALLSMMPVEETGPPKVVAVIDENVLATSESARQIGVRLKQSPSVDLLAGDTDVFACVLPGGEAVKNTSVAVDKVLAAINAHNLDRRSYVLVIGGGAVLDAAGFAAATAHRGVRLIRLPTTTLAQADSGVGVKNAINHFGKKNWMGTFAVPWAVINDAGLLSTLPVREFRCGFSEAVKVSLLKSKDDFYHLCENAITISNRRMDVAFDAIERSCRWHLRHITGGGDPFEARQARPLDFGHWSAHKMETLSDYQIRHGEAVAIGVALDCIYSSMAHQLPEEVMMATCKCLSQLGLNLWHPTLENPTLILDGLEEFRQHLGGQLTLTMLRDVGSPVDVHEICPQQMTDAIAKLKMISRQFG